MIQNNIIKKPSSQNKMEIEKFEEAKKLKEQLDRLKLQKRKLDEALTSCSLGVHVSYKVGPFNRNGEINIYNTELIKEMLEKELDGINEELVDMEIKFEKL